MAKPKIQSSELPVVRLNLAAPFLHAAQAAGSDIDQVLEPLRLSGSDFLDESRFVPAATMYDVVERLGDACNDIHIGFKLGTALDPYNWSPLADAAKSAHSLGDFLIRFSIDAYDDASSVVFKLETEGLRTTFHEQRIMTPQLKPRHNDAFGCAYLLAIIRGALGKAWRGSDVLASVSDPAAIPARDFGIRVATTSHNGFSISFPCHWLLLELDVQPSAVKQAPQVGGNVPPSGILTALRAVMESNLSNSHISTSEVARLCGISERTLARRLGEQGTTLKSELDRLRRQAAEVALSDEQLTIAEIGRRVGYQDATVFGRAFKRWTGVTPSTFRKLARSDSGQ